MRVALTSPKLTRTLVIGGETHFIASQLHNPPNGLCFSFQLKPPEVRGDVPENDCIDCIELSAPSTLVPPGECISSKEI